MKNKGGKITLFEGKKVRKTWYDGEWYFSVADIIEILTETKNVRQYIKKLRKRDQELNFYWGTNCPQIEMIAKDGKKRKITTANTEGIFRIIQSIPRKKAEDKLKVSEEKYKALFDNMYSAVAIFKPSSDGNKFYFKDFNKKAEKIENIKKEKILDREVREVFPGAVKMGIVDKLKKVYKTAKPENLIAQEYIDKKTAKKTYRNNFIFKISSGEIVVIYNDVTKQIKSKQVLKESEEKYRNLVERANDGIIIIQDSKIKYTNPKFAKSLGYSLKEVVGKPIVKFIHESMADDILKNYKDRMHGKKIPSVYEAALKSKNGKKIDIEINAGIINYEDRPADFVITRDISERKKILEKLEKNVEEIQSQKDKIDTIIKNIGDGLFMVDPNLKIILFNKKASELSGIKEKDAIGKKYTDVLKFVYEKDRKKISDAFLKEVIKTHKEKLLVNHTLLIDKNAKEIPVTNSAAPIKDKNGNFIGCVVVFRDVSREREIEKMKSEFVSIASHQLKTPLTGIKWMSELILREDLNKKEKEYAHDIHHSTTRVTKLIDDLLDVSHIETGRKFDIIKKKTDVVKIIKDIIKDNESLIKEHKIADIKIKSFPKELFLRVDPDKIKQVFSNVIDNAIKYSKAKGSIEINYKKQEDGHIFKIKDSGVGIPQYQQKRVFEKFFRADNAVQSESDGTGLGLFIAKAILDAHNGKIWFKSVEKKGTTFYIKLFK